MSDRPATPKDARLSRRQSHRSSGVHLLAPSMVHYDSDTLPLESLEMVAKFDRLSDSLDEMDTNMSQLQKLHTSISSEFNEAFSSFLYGLSITMWCVEFPGCPSRKKWDQKHANRQVDARIRALEQELREAQNNHSQLQLKLEEYEDSDDDDNATAKENSPAKESVPVSKIPQLKGKPDGLPNLNQPPRYMRGLFDSSNVRVPRKREGRVNKPVQPRPRFR